MGETLSRLGNSTDYVQAMADAYLQTDLNERFITNRAATYLPIAPDDGIEGIAIGDVLIVDRSIKPKPGHVIFAEIEGQYCLRRLVQDKTRLLLADDKGYIPAMPITNAEFYHGVVTHSIHKLAW